MAERRFGTPFEEFFARAKSQPGDDAAMPVPECRPGDSSGEECAIKGEECGMSCGDEEGSPWNEATWAGNRLRQHRELLSLSFREKLVILEQMGEVAARFGECRIGGCGWSMRSVTDKTRCLRRDNESEHHA